jgi:stage II sporulation protein D
MSQYGAYGAARKGLSWKQILAFYYYRGTQLSKLPSGTKMKVWITADNDNSLRSGRRAA